MVAEVESDVCRHGGKFVVRQVRECAARHAAGTVEPVAGVGHPIVEVRRPQAPFVERAVVRYQWQAIYERDDAPPHIGKYVGRGGVAPGETVDARVPMAVKVWRGSDQLVEFVPYRAVAHHHYPDAANAGTVAVGRLEIYRGKVFHRSCRNNVTICNFRETDITPDTVKQKNAV